LFGQLYGIEWTQHHFLYYDIQSLDIVQMPRMPADLAAYNGTFQLGFKQDDSGNLVVAPETFPRVARLWQLTNTRYLLGPAPLLDLFNGQFDPEQHRFRIVQRFNVLPKPGMAVPDGISPEQFANYLPTEKVTAFPNADGAYALFEFTGALPRAKLYSNWETNSVAALNGFTTNGLNDDELKTLGNVGTNDFLTLKKLVSPSFDPQQTVLLSAPLSAVPSTNQNSGTVGFKSYAPKDIVFNANAVAPSVLLLNDKFDPNWRVAVDGQPAQLLRCNYIMRGVYLAPGSHTVEFQFSLPNKPLYVTLVAIAAGLCLLGLLVFLQRRNPAAGT